LKEKYNFCNTCINPKRLKIGKDYIDEELQALFRPNNNKNGYQYLFSEDEKLIKQVEELWMIVHQHT
jgi:hypothetical protein